VTPRAVASFAVAVGLLAGATARAPAQTRPLTEPAEFTIGQWTTADGLPQNSVTAIAQTPDGYLWIGTFGGLARFDGTSFRLMPRVDSAGRHVDRVLSLAVGADSTLWIGTETGLLRFRSGSFEAVTAEGSPDDEVSALLVDRDGALWIGTRKTGVLRYSAGRFTRLHASSELPYVVSIEEDARGTIWVNLPDRLETIDRGTLAITRPRLVPTTAARMTLVDREGAHWFGAGEGLIRVRGDSVRVYGRREGVPARASMVEDPHDGYWLGTANDGLFHFEPRRRDRAVRHYALPDGRGKYRVRSSFVDRDGNVWFGTNANGLLRARRNVVTVYTAAHGLSHDVATAVYGDAGGTIWVGTNCGGLNAIDPSRGTVRTFKPRKPNDPTGDPCLFSLTEAPAGTMWAGTWGGGLTRLLDGREERLGRLMLRDSVVLALFTDRAGVVWVGTNAGGLAEIRDGRVRAQYTTADGLAHNSVRTIYQARDGALWIGTLGGLSRLARGRFTTFDASKGLSALHVRSIYEDAQGELWIGTYGGGLNRLRGDTLTSVRQRDGLADDVVSSILEDNAGRFWMSGNLGIWRVARDDLVAFTNGESRRVHSVIYGNGDGLQIAETNGGFQPAAWKDARGRLWYPTVHGVAMIDPTRTGPRESAPTVSVEQVVVDGQPSEFSNSIVIGPGSPNVEFRYAGLSLSAPSHIRYRYRLVGYEDDWVEPGARRVAYYSRVPPGQYRFVVSAANRDGVWNETGTELPVRVLGPFWSAVWFQLVAVAALVAIGMIVLRRRALVALRWRVAQEEFSRRLLESQERERKRIAGELHDGLGQELLVIKNRALLALRASDSGKPVREQLEHISSVVSQSLESVRGLAHRLTPYQLDHLGLTTALRAMVEETGGTMDGRFEMNIEDIDGLLSLESQINLYRIVQEALNNVVSHSGATVAAIHARRAGDTIAVTVRDNGRGFAVLRDGAGSLAGGFGISSIAGRARILDGQVDIISAPGQGTRLELTVPVTPSVVLPPGVGLPSRTSARETPSGDRQG
jgi:ligand-binding sensor domain-containing protein/signal transduction histidine kinase